MKNVKNILLLVLVALGCAISSTATVMGNTPDSTTHPNTLELINEKPTVVVEKTFQIQLRQSDLNREIRGYQCFISFNPAVLQVEFISLLTDQYDILLWKEYDNTIGTIELSAGAWPTKQPSTDNAIIATIAFKSISAGISPIAFMKHEPPTIFAAAQPPFEVIPYLKSTSVVVNMPNTLELINEKPTVVVKKTFQIQLRQSDLNREIRGYQCFISFNPAVLQVEFISLSTDQYDISLWKEYDNTIGTIELSAGAWPTKQPSTDNAIIATIAFKSISTGISPIAFMKHEPPTIFAAAQPPFEVIPYLKSTSVIITR